MKRISAVKSRSFPLATLLQSTTGKLFVDWDEFRDLLAFMTSSRDYVQEIIAFEHLCRPEILRQHPQLIKISQNVRIGVTRVNGTNYKRWLSRQVRRFGRTLKISPFPSNLPGVVRLRRL
jgi:hypothetical protein